MRDDELLDALADELRSPVPEADPDRVAAIRAAASAAAASTPGDQRSSWSASRRTSRRYLLAGAAAAVAVLGGVATLALTADGPDGTTEYAGPVEGPAGTGTLSVVETGIGRVVTIDSTDLVILPKGEYYEAWFVGPDDEPGAPDRISAGTFHPRPDGVTVVTLAAAVDPAIYPHFEITAEEGDGDPSSSGNVVLEADLAR